MTRKVVKIMKRTLEYIPMNIINNLIEHMNNDKDVNKENSLCYSMFNLMLSLRLTFDDIITLKLDDFDIDENGKRYMSRTLPDRQNKEVLFFSEKDYAFIYYLSTKQKNKKSDLFLNKNELLSKNIFNDYISKYCELCNIEPFTDIELYNTSLFSLKNYIKKNIALDRKKWFKFLSGQDYVGLSFSTKYINY